MILDEPTNSMDSQTEKGFVKRMAELIGDKTLILITHKMSVLSLVDRVIILEDGKIIADGLKEEVFKPKKVEQNV